MENEKKKVMGYKIRRKSDGLYMKRGSYGGFSKHGSVWGRLQDAIASLRLKKMPEDTIVDLEIIELAEINSYSGMWLLGKIKK